MDKDIEISKLNIFTYTTYLEFDFSGHALYVCVCECVYSVCISEEVHRGRGWSSSIFERQEEDQFFLRVTG